MLLVFVFSFSLGGFDMLRLRSANDAPCAEARGGFIGAKC